MPRRRTRRHGILAILVCAAALIAPARARAVVTQFQAFPGYFSPNSDGVQDQVKFTWTLTDSARDVSLRIASPAATLQRVIDLGPQPAGTDSASWNGLDATLTAIFPDSTYDVFVTETPVTGAATSGHQSVQLDTTPPALPVIDGAVDSVQTDSTYSLTGTASGADSAFVYRDGAVIARLPLPAGPDPTFAVSNIHLHVGPNQFAVQSRDLAGNVSTLTPPITVTWVNVPDIDFIRGTTTLFSPNGDGVEDTTRVRVALDAPAPRLEVGVRTGAAPSNPKFDLSSPVTSLYDAPAPADTLSFVWDGRDSVGQVMPDGEYAFRALITQLDAHGDSIGVQARFSTITLDNTPPSAPHLAQLPLATTFRNFETLKGTATGADSVFVLEAGNHVLGFEGSEFTFELPLVPGANTFSLQASDLAGNLSSVSGPYTVDYQIPVGFHANERFRPADSFVFNLAKAANEIDLTLYTLRGRIVRTLRSRQVELHFDLPWDGKDELGAFAGDGPYMARAEISYTDGTHAEVKGAVVLVK